MLHGSFLTFALGWFQLERLVFVRTWTGTSLPWSGIVVQVLLEAGLGLLLTGLAILAGRTQRLARAVPWLLPLGCLGFYLLLVIDHHFFYNTGSRATPALLGYAIANLIILRGIIEESIEPDLVLRFVILPIWIILPWGLSRLRPWYAPSRKAAVVVTSLGLGLVLIIPPDVRVGTSTLVELIRGNPQARYLKRFQDEAAVKEVYHTPKVGPFQRRPSMLVLILESVGADCLAPTAARQWWGRYPHLEALAERSVVFSTTYTAVSHTSKMHVAFFTGMYPRLSMPVMEATPGNLPVPGIPAILADAGYRTGYMQPAPEGFENWRALMQNLGFVDTVMMEDLEPDRWEHTGYFGMDERSMIEPAIEYMSGDEPFFLVLHTITTHHPYESPGETEAQKKRPWAERHRVALSTLDGFVGELLAAMEEAGLSDVVIWTVGDHGEAFGQHGRFLHDAVPYEETVRVPFWVSAGDLTGPPRIDRELRHQLDFFPTVLEMVGAEWDGLLPGRSAFGPGHDEVFSACYISQTCMARRRGPMKYISHFGRFPFEAYDLSQDPWEQRDLAPGMTPQEIHAAEVDLVGEHLSIQAFWDQHPIR